MKNRQTVTTAHILGGMQNHCQTRQMVCLGPVKVSVNFLTLSPYSVNWIEFFSQSLFKHLICKNFIHSSLWWFNEWSNRGFEDFRKSGMPDLMKPFSPRCEVICYYFYLSLRGVVIEIVINFVQLITTLINWVSNYCMWGEWRLDWRPDWSKRAVIHCSNSGVHLQGL